MKRAISVLLVCLLVVQPVVAQSAGSQIETRQADLAVETPPDFGSASESSEDGMTLYRAEAGPLELHPQNFDEGSVVDFGVVESNGTLGYQAEFGQYNFEASAAGTYEVFWVVSETIATENGSRQTVNVRYEALVRVGVSDSVSLSQSEVESLRSDAQRWQQFNGTLDELMEYESFYAPEPGSKEELVDKMTNAYQDVHAIHKQLGGDISTVIIILVTTLGGWLLVAILALWQLGVVGSLWKRLNRFRSNEAVEGELSERMADLDKKEREFTLENSDLQDVEGISDREAAAFRDVIDGVSLRDANEHLSDTVLSPAALTLDRLYAMGAAGYAAKLVEEDTRYADTREFDVEIVPPEDIPAGTDIDVTAYDDLEEGDEWFVDLSSMGGEMGRLLLQEMDEWDPEAVRAFDMADEELDLGDIEYDFETADLETLMDDLGVDEARFGSVEEFGRTLRELVEHVRHHAYTEGDGSPNPTRATLERLLKITGILADKHHVPEAEWQRQAIERALLEYDAGERTEQTIKDIQRGRGVGAD